MVGRRVLIVTGILPSLPLRREHRLDTSAPAGSGPRGTGDLARAETRLG